MRKKRIKPSMLLLHIIFVLLCVGSIYPILLVLFNAISSESYIVEYGYVAWPKGVTLDAFKALFRAPGQMINATLISIMDSVGGPIVAIIVNSLAGYALLRDDFIFKKPFKAFLMLAMFLPSVGLIPHYMVHVKLYHMENNILEYLLAGAAAPMSIFLYRTFFRSIPHEIVESARIDGASEMQIWSKIMIPLSKTFIATQFFLGLSGRWKDYSTSLYYMTDPKLQNLEYYVQQIVKDISVLRGAAVEAGMNPAEYPAETVTFAVVFMALIPVMVIFPLCQKYFEKGAVVGSIKG